ncbi:MAG: hypothetical protein ACTSU5_05035 [Promethearchaeota archaeon]
MAPESDYSFAVQAVVCELRWRYKHAYGEIAAGMSERFQIEVSPNTVENIPRIYEVGCALKYRSAVVEKCARTAGSS